MRQARIAGYTLIETIVALLLFTIGGLALVSTSAMIGRAMRSNASRERAGRMAASRLEILGAGCGVAASGREAFQQIESEWSVAFVDSARVSIVESVSYPTGRGRRKDLFRAVLPCAR
ncbi:MAG TPA: prepilin-type N-terminal cleavage/methylation domain-containing protein [Gemmatimonadaceae bacterium]|nr:prepilin-type N-terminal cleavage/methylation domain-containing protein [Gemmatimonadaceae bacterium]